VKPRIIDCEQRTPEWYVARAGRLTGSVADNILSTLKSGGEPAGRRDLRIQLAVERITGQALDWDGFTSKEMQRGIDLEGPARSTYEAETGHIVRTTGFIIWETHPVGCSLDGDIDDLTGILELKCPKSATHLSYLRDQRLPPAYVAQVTHNLWVTGAAWCDFVSFDDRLPQGLQYFRKRIGRAELDIPSYAIAATKFLAEVEAERLALLELRGSS
jgi:predicted phage-related endonuclease